MRTFSILLPVIISLYQVLGSLALARPALCSNSSPPQMIAQLENNTPAKPIPAVNSRGIELEEIKPTASVEVKVSRERVFRTKRKILRVSVSDPSIAEPVVVSDREFMLIGKNPGAVSLFVWYDEPER